MLDQLTLTTPILSFNGIPVKYGIQHTSDESTEYHDLYVANEHIGRISLVREENCLFIMGMDNLTVTKPLSLRYKSVGLALHEIAFRLSISYGYEGRVQLSAIKGTYLFHSRCGFVPFKYDLRNPDGMVTDSYTQRNIQKTLADAIATRANGNSDGHFKATLGFGPMYLPPDTIEKLKIEYFARPPLPKSPQETRMVASPVIGDSTYSKLEKLVKDGQISRENADNLKKLLTSPREPDDHQTWLLALSPGSLKSMKYTYISGEAIGTYFSRNNSEKLKYMFGLHGLHAFSQFLIGWDECRAMSADSLRFLLSDYGILALEQELLSPTHFLDQDFVYREFTAELYENLRTHRSTPESLFQPRDPIAKP